MIRNLKFNLVLALMAAVLLFAGCNRSLNTKKWTTGDVVTFGRWPQTIKSEKVTITTEAKIVGAFTYFKGSDGEWYAKLAERACRGDCTYSDGTAVGMGGTTEKYFKVEPIKWRVLIDNYNGKKLLFAENILINCAYHDNTASRDSFLYGKIYPNNYEESRIRAYLNGLSYEVNNRTTSETFLNKGFLQTAFTESELVLIAETTVDNSEISTNPDQWNNHNNPYASGRTTTDKIFLLSMQEVTTEVFGFDYDTDSTRIRVATDFAKASGVSQSTVAGYGGCWWLRSPYYMYSSDARNVERDGTAVFGSDVRSVSGGVVPALCIE